eukprot:gene15889-biopygen4433
MPGASKSLQLHSEHPISKLWVMLVGDRKALSRSVVSQQNKPTVVKSKKFTEVASDHVPTSCPACEEAPRAARVIQQKIPVKIMLQRHDYHIAPNQASYGTTWRLLGLRILEGVGWKLVGEECIETDFTPKHLPSIPHLVPTTLKIQKHVEIHRRNTWSWTIIAGHQDKIPVK